MNEQNTKNADTNGKYSKEAIIEQLGGKEACKQALDLCLRMVDAGLFDHITYDDIVRREREQ